MENMPRPDWTFERFVVTDASREAFSLAAALAANERSAPRLLLLCGPAGVGKTHLLRSILHVAARQPGSTLYRTASDWIDALVRSLCLDPAAQRQAVGEPPTVTAVDDLHVLVGKPATQREIGVRLGDLLESGGRVACAAGCRLDELPALVGILRKLPSAQVVALASPDKRALPQILRRLAKSDHLRMSPRTIAAIATRCEGDVRRAMGAMTRERFEQQAQPLY